MRQWFAVLTLVGACTQGTSDGPSTDDPVTTDTTDDYVAPPIEAAEITFAITGDWDGTALTVTRIGDPSAETFTDLQFGSVLASMAVTEDAPSMTLEPLAPETLDANPSVAEVSWAVFHVALHADADGDAAHDAGEVYRAVGTTSLVYLHTVGRLPVALASAGFSRGWNVAQLLGSDALASGEPVGEFRLDIPEESPTIQVSGSFETFDYGDYTGDTGAFRFSGDTGQFPPLGPDRLALVPGAALAETDDTSPIVLLADVPLSEDEPWTIFLDGAPPVNHTYQNDPVLPDGVAVEYPINYTDQDESESYTSADYYFVTACDVAAQSQVQLAWVPGTDDLAFATATRGHVGWVALFEPLETGYGGYYGDTGGYGYYGDTGGGTGFDTGFYYGAPPLGQDLRFPDIRTGVVGDLTLGFSCYGYY